MDESLNMEGKLQSAAAFVEGGIQDACDDSCSICLEAFCENDPSTVTSCKHEFHLQCILEWCQRSSQCPMCWQPISLKDPTSQELFEGVEHERNIRSNQTRNATIFHHPALGDFELQHLPDGELEERIIQHLAAAAAMGRARHISRREGQRGRSAAQGRPEFLVFATHPNASSVGSVSSAPRVESEPSAAAAASPSSVNADVEEESSRQVSVVNAPQADPVTPLSSGSSIANANRHVFSNSRVSAGQTTPVGQDRAGPSDLQSFSESLKSRLNAVSMRYKDSITKNTRGWKERLFSRNTSVADIGSEVRREVSAGIASVSRMMERLDTRDGRRTANSSGQQSSTDYSENQPNNGTVPESNSGGTLSNDNNTSTTPAATTTPS